MKEVNRRLSCLQKPEKRLVLIGMQSNASGSTRKLQIVP